MRAHAMFSAQGLPLGSDTLEYAWLIDMQAGGLTGRVTVPQVCVCLLVVLHLTVLCYCIRFSLCFVHPHMDCFFLLLFFCSVQLQLIAVIVYFEALMCICVFVIIRWPV